MNIAFIDTETTGVNFLKHQIIQYACVITDERNYEISRTQFFMEATREIDSEASAISDYYVGKWNDKNINHITYDEVINRIILNLKSADIVIIHNSPFDSSFIKALAFEYNIQDSELPKYWLDFATLAWLFKQRGILKSHSLSNTAKYFNVSIKQNKNGKHDAMQDVEILRELYFKLTKYITVYDPKKLMEPQ